MSYFEAIDENQTIKPVDVNLEYIKQALFSFFGIKEPQPSKPVSGFKSSGFPMAEMTKDEMDSWIKAGYPSLKTGWLKRYRDGDK